MTHIPRASCWPYSHLVLPFGPPGGVGAPGGPNSTQLYGHIRGWWMEGVKHVGVPSINNNNKTKLQEMYLQQIWQPPETGLISPCKSPTPVIHHPLTNILYYTILYYTILHYTILYYNLLYDNIQYNNIHHNVYYIKQYNTIGGRGREVRKDLTGDVFQLGLPEVACGTPVSG